MNLLRGLVVALVMSMLIVPSMVSQSRKPRPKITVSNERQKKSIEDVSNSTVQVILSSTYSATSKAADKPGQTIPGTFEFSGTGFKIDDDWNIVTAYHVVDSERLEAEAKKYELSQGRTLIDGSFKMSGIKVLLHGSNVDNGSMRIYQTSVAYQASMLTQDEAYDIAILSCPILGWQEQANCKTYGECNSLNDQVVVISGSPSESKRTIHDKISYQIEQPKRGDRISVVGFPGLLGVDTGAPGLIVNSGIVSNSMVMDKNGKVFYLAELRVNQGDSGGPVFNDSDGRIIGFADAFQKLPDGSNSGMSKVIPMKYIMELARKSAVKAN